MKKLILILSVLTAQLAFADTKIIFFGGHGASQEEMDCWVAGAKRQKAWAGYKFAAYPYPDTSDFKHPDVIAGAARSEINAIVREINSHPHTHYIIMGHSSGCAVSDAIAEKITNPNHAELINLEGFQPSQALQKRMKTLCVYSLDTRHGMSQPTALGKSMKNCANSLPVPVKHCKSTHCLHFSLVNRMSPEELHYDYPTNGYNGCYANLTFIPEKTTQMAAEEDGDGGERAPEPQDGGASS